MAVFSWLSGFLVFSVSLNCVVGKSCSSVALGLEDGTIFDEQLSASAEHDQYHRVNRSRLKMRQELPYFGGWAPPSSPPENRINSWLQADLLIPTIVTHIGTQGRDGYDEWVTKYSVQFSSDGASFMDFADGKILNGSFDRQTVKINFLEVPIVARYIRVVVKEFKDHVGMRWELYGCAAEYNCKIGALGMENNGIPDAKITASSMASNFQGPSRSRINTTLSGQYAGAWSPVPMESNPWIQVDLTRMTKVTRIEMQGRSDQLQWVKTYTLGFCLYDNGISPFNDYEKGKVFTANTDQNTVVSNDLDPPIVAVYVRLYPKTYQSAPSMRWELHGCVPEPCDDPLGMQTGMILDSKITASSNFSSNTSAPRARLGLMLHNFMAGGWRAAEYDNTSWIQIDLSGETTVTRIAIQGRSDKPQWVKSYSLQYGVMEGKLYEYEDGTVFNANTDQNNVVSSILDPPIVARYVRLLPKTYYGAVALRMELYGCRQEFCEQALGMQSRSIPNERITASSSYSNQFLPHLARLGMRNEGTSFGAWAPVQANMATVSWIQADLGQQTTVSQIATQGRPDLAQWVKSYTIQYGAMEGYLMEYRNRSNTSLFNGNTDQNTIVFNVLDPPIFTRYVRIWPKSYQLFVSMRFELYGGCDHPGCKDYTPLSSRDRLKTVPKTGAPVKCDMDKLGWYRFVGDAGTQIATTCMPGNYCQTNASGWMNGSHPSPSDGSVNRTVCFSWGSNCCRFSTPINVRNCGSYFIYYFDGSHHCNLRYCSEKVSVSLASGKISDKESKTQSNIPVERTASFSYLPFNLSITNGTALSTSDFEAVSPLLVTFSPGQSTVNAILPVVEDDIYEIADETFTVQLSGSFANVYVDKMTIKTVTIEEDDNECYVYNNFSAFDRFEDETTVGSPKCDNNTTYGWYRIIGASGTELATSCPSYNKCGGNTTMWMETKHPVVSDRRETRKICYSQHNQCCNRSHDIHVRNCGTFYVYKLSSPLVCARYCTSKLEVFLMETWKEFNETIGTFTLRLNRTGKDLNKLTTHISVSTSNGPHTATPNRDFKAVALEVTLNPPGVSDDLVFFIFDDNITESTETFSIHLSTTDGATVTNGLATINILDDDQVTLSLEQSSYSVYEDVGYLDIKVFCDGLKEVPIRYRLTTFNGTAIGAMNLSTSPYSDFVHLPGVEKEFSEMESMHSIRISFNVDNTLENNETFMMKLESLVPQYAIVKPNSSAQVTIKNDDWVSVQFTKPVFKVTEGIDTDFLQVMMNGTTGIDVHVRVSSLNHSAYSKYDYTALANKLLTFTPTHTSPTIMNIAVNITDEALIENDEQLKMILTTNQDNVHLGRNVTEIHILNNDKATIGFTKSSLVAFENAGNVTVCMYKRGLAAIPLTVTLNTMSGTAKAHVDYEAISNLNITFSPAAQNQSCTNVTIKDNDITEYTKIFYIKMTTKDPAIIENMLTLTILNDDKVTLEFEEIYKLTVEESLEEGKIDLICAITEGVSAIPVHINFTENPNKLRVTADHGDDFVLKNHVLTFHPGTTRMNMTIYIIPDGEVESDEIFSVQILSDDETHVVAGTRQLAFVKIKDGRDFAKSEAQKQEQQRKVTYRRMVFIVCIVAICLLFVITLTGVILLFCLIQSKLL